MIFVVWLWGPAKATRRNCRVLLHLDLGGVPVGQKPGYRSRLEQLYEKPASGFCFAASSTKN